MNSGEKIFGDFVEVLKKVSKYTELMKVIERYFSILKPVFDGEKVIVSAMGHRREIALIGTGAFETSAPTKNGFDLSGFAPGVKRDATQLATELGRLAGHVSKISNFHITETRK